ncbi:MAG: MATE family efflux transporter [Rikenellaceae bacterium]
MNQQQNRQATKLNELEHEAIPRLLWRYFVPAFTGIIINALYNIVDRIFIGQYVDSMALAGLSAVFPIMTIIAAFGMMVGLGAGARVSINMGKRDFDRVALVMGNAVVLTCITATFLTVSGYLAREHILGFFGVGEATYSYAKDYVDIVIGGIIFNIMGYSMCDLIRSQGNARVAMTYLMISASMNILLDYIFVVHLGWGVKGAAYATVLSQMALATLALSHFRSKRAVVRFKGSDLRLTKDIVWYIISIGFAPFAMQVASSAVFGFLNVQLVKYGNDTAVGALGIIISINMLVVMTIMAINMANQPIIGFNYGAGNLKRVKETWLTSMAFATLISVVGFFVILFFPEYIIRLFNRDDAELLGIGVDGLRRFLIAMPVIGFQVVTVSYFQSTSRPQYSVTLSLTRQVLVLIPLIWLLPRFWGLQGVWIAPSVADVISAMISFVFVWREYRKLNGEIAAVTELK